jgi:hypothetical protein
MLRLFSLFGKSAAMNALDDALRASGVHPLLVPEAVKITVIRLLKREASTAPQEARFVEAATLLAYCILGRDPFVESNGARAADRAYERLEAAIAAGDSLDARLILLALHAGLIAPDIADRIDVEDR